VNDYTEKSRVGDEIKKQVQKLNEEMSAETNFLVENEKKIR